MYRPRAHSAGSAGVFITMAADFAVMAPHTSIGAAHPVSIGKTACRSCYSEMLTLKKLREEVGGFEVLGVFLDMKPKNFKSYMDENALPFQFTWDANYSIAQSYGVSFTPASFLLDGDRKVVAAYRGFHPGTERTMKADVERVAGKK